MHAKEVTIVDEILGCVLVDDDEAVAIRSLEDADNPLINDVSDWGAIFRGFALSRSIRANGIIISFVVEADECRLPITW